MHQNQSQWSLTTMLQFAVFFFSILRYEHCILKMLYQAKSSSTQTFQDPFIHSFMLYFSYFWMPLHPSAFCVNSSPADIRVQLVWLLFVRRKQPTSVHPNGKRRLKVNFGLNQIIRNENSLSMINDSVTKWTCTTKQAEKSYFPDHNADAH